jgi:deoxyribodipyrimidine photo-lyase
LADNSALVAAGRDGGAVVPVFIWSPEEEWRWPAGAASRWWLHHSLAALDAALRRRGSRLILRRGPARRAIRELLHETGAGAVYWNRRYEPTAREQERVVEAELRRARVAGVSFDGSLLFEPEAIRTKAGAPCQVFTPFWKACLREADPPPPIEPPAKLAVPRRWPASLKLAELNLLPAVEWAAGIRATWTPGEQGAAAQLERFVAELLDEYPTDRDRPDLPGTSRLSPHLHFGEIGPRQVWHAVRRSHLGDAARRPTAAVERFCAELGWREFGRHLLFHFPDTPDKPLRPEFARFRWRTDRHGLRAWQRGETGYPIVDAAMRELWRTGWMHNRARMIVASFLVKDLLISWRAGAAWFWDTLVDADLASNTLGWQWSAGCGADAAPYFRVFNPVTQGAKFDPQGRYVRRWVPELARLPDGWIHRPWEAPADVLREARVRLDVTYPRPIVDHLAARERALAAFAEMRKGKAGGDSTPHPGTPSRKGRGEK